MKEEIIRFTTADDIATNIEFLELYIQCFSDIVEKHQLDEVESGLKADAKMILQMLFSKLIHLRKILEGVTFINKEGKQLINPIIDATIVITLVRSIYEQVCLFNLIYDSTDDEEKRNLVYYLWVSAGLKSKQRFKDDATTPENKEKVEEDKKKIEELKLAIEDMQTYKDLDASNQGKIQKQLQKDFKVKIEGGNVRILSWQDISKEFMTKSDFFDNMYKYFSLHAHPSQVSVSQFADMFEVGNEGFKGITVFNIKLCVALMSSFIGDYIRLFPEVKTTFENRPEIDQIMLNFYNRVLRGDEKSISEVWKKLE